MKQILEFTVLGINISSFLLTIIGLCLPWYGISIKGYIDGDYYDTTARFGLYTYNCDYSNNITNGRTLLPSGYKKAYGNSAGSECYPIVPPTASLFGLGIALIIGSIFICISFIPSIISIILQITMLKPTYKVIWVKIVIFITSIITLVFYILGFLYSANINQHLNSYNADDNQSTSSDEFTVKLCDDLWCTSMIGSSNYSPLVQDVQSQWGPSSGFYIAVISCAFTFLSGVLTLFISTPKKHSQLYNSYVNLK